MTDDPPPIRHYRPPPNPREIPFEPQLEHPPLTPPQKPKPDPVLARRVEAERLVLWMACRRALCRSSRRCVGTWANCVFENPDITDPILK